MSRADAQIRFPDGTIKYGIYNGTIDHYWFPLFDSPEKAWEAWQEYYKSESMDDSKWGNSYDDSFYDVVIADDYGGGGSYIGRASKSQIVSATNVDFMNSIKRRGIGGLPDWWANAKDEGSEEPKSGEH